MTAGPVGSRSELSFDCAFDIELPVVDLLASERRLDL